MIKVLVEEFGDIKSNYAIIKVMEFILNEENMRCQNKNPHERGF
jgi:hypothetical protein